jgi:hypothetical protein
MDRATTTFLERQSEESKRREKEVQPEPATTVLVKKIAGDAAGKLDDEHVRKMGGAFHYGMGIGGAYLAGIFLARGWRAIPAGMAAGTLIWLLFDEGLNYALGLAAPASEFPPETHLRGLVGHMAYGAALGGLLSVSRRLWKE